METLLWAVIIYLGSIFVHAAAVLIFTSVFSCWATSWCGMASYPYPAWRTWLWTALWTGTSSQRCRPRTPGKRTSKSAKRWGSAPQMGALACLTVAVSGVGGVLKASMASRAFSRWWSACRRCGSPGWKASRRCLSWSRCAATSPIWPSLYTAAVWAPPTWSGAPPSNKNTQKHTHVVKAVGVLFSSSLPAVRDLIREAVKMLVHMKALDHIISVAAEQGIKDIKQLLET